MAEEWDDEETEAAEAAVPQPRNGKRKAMIAAAVAAAVLLGGGGAGYMVISGKKSATQHAAGAADDAKAAEDAEAALVDVPAMIVNLRAADGATRYLKVHLMLVLGNPGRQAEIGAKLPMIVDAYQPFLRELRPEDLAGSAAVYRLKEEMLVRANAALGDGAVKDVLVQDLIQQ